MGFYEHRVLPHLIHRAMRQRQLVAPRERLLAATAGRVLEIGIGSGPNLPLYPRDTELVVGLDPSAELLARARREAAWTHFPVQLHRGSAEAIPFDDGSFDSVVSTWTLCSIPDAGAALAEVRRVLRPGGRLLFAEHGRAPEPRVATWQDRLTPLWRRIGGGCHLNRPIDALLRAAGLRIDRLETGYLVKGPRPWTYHYVGSAAP
ncbi:MAG TPA: class I SAM-dependent methyltransferase [Geminicoccaceae bacterium]|nr:class I SAM-dependent methyltransferase [Geminicoccaceae bacterium]